VNLKLDNPNLDIRETPEYIQAKRLICEKAEIQNRLRAVDKRLRQLRAASVEAMVLARTDLETETNGFKKLENARLHQQAELKW
jgi:tRNA U34 5-methylaminomethyl-2-thiouridine-forming methyltransferase MnmC